MSDPVELAGTIQTALDDAKVWLQPFMNKLLDLDEETNTLLRCYNNEKQRRERLTMQMAHWEASIIDNQGSDPRRLEESKRRHRQTLEACSRCQAFISRTLDDIKKANDKRQRYEKLLSDANKALRALNQGTRGGEEDDDGGQGEGAQLVKPEPAEEASLPQPEM